MSLTSIHKLLKTYTTSAQNDEYCVRDVMNVFFSEQKIPKLDSDEKVFIRGNTLLFTTHSSVRTYEVNRIKIQLINRIKKIFPQHKSLTGIRFL